MLLGLRPDPLPDEPNDVLLARHGSLRALKDHLAAVIADHLQHATPLRGIKVEIVFGGLGPAVKNQLNVMQGPKVKRDPIDGIETEAGCLPFDLRRDSIIRVQNSQP
jgi:hypothetical protein